MTQSFGYYLYPWATPEVERTLDEMAEAGFGHVTVAASYHAGKFIQPSGPARVYFPQDGAVYFHPRRTDYGRLTPVVAEATKTRDVLDAFCADGRLGVRAWTVLNHNSRLGWLHPDVSAANAWGDRYPYSLCPSHPEVRHYAVTLCADLAAGYPLRALVLETPGWVTYDHGYHHEFAQVAPDPWLSGMLGLCFCPSCVDGAGRAGLDAAALAAEIRRKVDAVLAGEFPLTGAAERLEADLAPGEPLHDYIQWRCDVVTSLCRDIRAAVRPQVEVRIISTCQRPHATTFWEGGDLPKLLAVADGLEAPIYQPSSAEAQADLDYVRRCIGPSDKLSVILRPGHPDMVDEVQFRDTLTRIRGRGINDISFYNMSLLPPANRRWVERALNAAEQVV